MFATKWPSGRPSGRCKFFAAKVSSLNIPLNASLSTSVFSVSLKKLDRFGVLKQLNQNDLFRDNLRTKCFKGENLMKKLFAILVVSLMTVSSFAIANGCSGPADHDQDAKKKYERGA